MKGKPGPPQALALSNIDSDKTACPCIVNLTVNVGWLQIYFCFPKVEVRKEKAELSLKLQKGHASRPHFAMQHGGRLQ